MQLRPSGPQPCCMHKQFFAFRQVVHTMWTQVHTSMTVIGRNLTNACIRGCLSHNTCRLTMARDCRWLEAPRTLQQHVHKDPKMHWRTSGLMGKTGEQCDMCSPLANTASGRCSVAQPTSCQDCLCVQHKACNPLAVPKLTSSIYAKTIISR